MTTNTEKRLSEVVTKREVVPLINACLAGLVEYQDEINRLNVYPVPDGDTGTNMVLTMKHVRNEAIKVEGASVQELAGAITYGSLMGARGNSGVILSQIIRGFFAEIEKHEEITSDIIIQALKGAADVAYKAVKKPVEGTMLTVIKDMASAAANLEGKSIHPIDLLAYLVEEGKRSVERTPELLPILKESGVVDAGGYGLLVMAKGILAGHTGSKIGNGFAEPAGAMTVVDEHIEYAYCTEFILKSDGVDMEALQKDFDGLGDSTLVVGTPELTKIHVHTNDPGKVLQIATSLGSITEVQINNIIEQSEQRARALEEQRAAEQRPGIGIVAVATGNGVREILENLGVDVVVAGGQSMNPSTAELVEAVRSLSRSEAIILPNNTNIILAAQQVDALVDATVRVIPTRSIPEAFASLLAFDPGLSLDENVEAMGEECTAVKTGEVTCAVRDAHNGDFKTGDFIALYDGEIVASGSDLMATTLGLLEAMVDEDSEVITVLGGDRVDGAVLDALPAMLRESFPDVEAEVHFGGQPVYHFIIGVE